jgi:F-type H+-transporting ATPase subunit gamma
MERLSEIEARVASFTQLQDVISVMRSLAATRVQQAQNSLAGIRAYSDTIGAAIAAAESYRTPERDHRAADRFAVRGVILFCGEHGFCGAFSEKLLESVSGNFKGAELYIVGSRGALMAEERKIPVEWSTPMATNIGTITTVAHVVAEALYDRFSRGAMADVTMTYARYGGHGRFSIEREVLLPLDLGRFRSYLTRPAPLSNLPSRVLIDRLIEEYFFAQLVRGATESFASENAARVALTQSARHSIEGRLEELVGAQRQLRQQQITNEILEVISGAEALSKPH